MPIPLRVTIVGLKLLVKQGIYVIIDAFKYLKEIKIFCVLMNFMYVHAHMRVLTD